MYTFVRNDSMRKSNVSMADVWCQNAILSTTGSYGTTLHSSSGGYSPNQTTAPTLPSPAPASVPLCALFKRRSIAFPAPPIFRISGDEKSREANGCTFNCYFLVVAHNQSYESHYNSYSILLGTISSITAASLILLLILSPV